MILFLTGCYPGEDFGVNVSMYVENAEGGLCSANITSYYQINDGDPSISEVGICWEETSSDILPTIKRNSKKATNVTSPYSMLITDLKESTWYVVRPYMQVDGFIVYGDELAFKTPSNSQYLPKLGNLKLVKAELDKLSVSSSIAYVPVEYPITEAGVCYTDQSVDDFTMETTGVKTVKGELTDGKFDVDVTNLNFSTIYKVRAYAKNQAGIIYGNIESFRTAGDEYVPKLGEVTITKNAPTYLELSCTITEPLKTDSIKAWFEYREYYNSTLSVEAKITKGIMTAKIENLQPSTNFNIVAKAENKFGVGSSNNKQVTTDNGEKSKPTVNVPSITNIKADGAHVESKIKIVNAEYKALSGGFECSTSSYLHSSVAQKGIIENDTILKLNLSELSENTTYYIRAYVETKLGKIYSTTTNFTTAERKPTISKLNVKSILKRSVSLSAMVKPYDKHSSITEAGVQYTRDSYFSSMTMTQEGTIIGDSVFVDLSNLDKGTKYLMRAYAISNNSNYYNVSYYGPEKSITTKSDADYTPTITKVIVSDTTMTSMTLSSTYTLINEDYKVKEAGFQYYKSTNPSYVSSGSLYAGNIKDGTITLSISNLTGNSTYQVRPYIKLDDESVYYGKTISVNTKKESDYFEETIVSDLTMTSFKLSSKHKFPSQTYKIKDAGFQYYKSAYPSYVSSGSLKSGVINNGTITLSFSGLTANSVYQIRPYIKLENETIYYGNTKTVTTKQPSDYFSEVVVSDLTPNSFKLSSEHMFPTEEFSITEAGFQCNNGYVGNGKLYVGDIEGTKISLSFSELTALVTYQVRPYVKLDDGTVYYGNTIKVKTKDKEDFIPIISNVEVNDIMLKSAKVKATIDIKDERFPILKAGFVFVKSGYWTYVEGQVEGNVLTAVLDGLQPGTTYKQLSAYADTSLGRNKGEETSFTTLSTSVLPSVVCNDITSVTTSSFSIEADVKKNHKSYPITEAGFVYIKSTSSSALTLNTNNAIRKSLTVQDGKIKMSVDGLDNNSTYLVRAYAISGNEISYNEKTIRVYTNMDNYKPSMGTLSIEKTNGEYIASCKAIVSQVFPITDSGFVYSTSTYSPTLENNVGIVSAQISESLISNKISFKKPQTGTTTYYVRAYAKNANGVTYSSYRGVNVSWND